MNQFTGKEMSRDRMNEIVCSIVGRASRWGEREKMYGVPSGVLNTVVKHKTLSVYTRKLPVNPHIWHQSMKCLGHRQYFLLVEVVFFFRPIV